MIKRNYPKGQGIDISPIVFFIFGLFFVLFGFFISRIHFLSIHHEYFLDASFDDVLLALLHGLRFDLSAIALLNAPLLLLLFGLVWFRALSTFNTIVVFGYLLLVNGTAITINLIDAAYFPYTGRRSGPEVFSMANDVNSQFPQIIFVYWEYAIATLLIFSFYFWLFLRLKKCNRPFFLKGIVLIPLCFLLVLIFIVAGRGGLQSKPIRALNAYSYPASNLGVLVLNTPFSLLREDPGNLERVHFYSKDSEIEKLLYPRMDSIDDSEVKKHNVVVLILESFGIEYFGPPYGLHPYTPFLQKLSEQGRFFPNGIANGRRSIEAVPSILAGIPSLMTEAFMRSPYQSNTVYGIGEIVKPYGYSTAFFHGAKNGSMYFDDTTYRFGFNHYYGLNEYPDSDHFDGQWGIFDEPFLQFTIEQLDKLPKPFLSGIFTISSHPPYTLPEEYEEIIEKGEIPMHRVVQYTDMALQRFFEKASQKDWYENTLFIITADHTSDNFDRRFASSLGRHQVPIILFQPNQEIEKGVVTEIAQQIDIPATIVDYLNLPERDKTPPFGRSLLVKNNQADAIIKTKDAYWILSQNKFVKLPVLENSVIETGYLPNTFVNNFEQSDGADFEQLENRLKAYVQIFTNGMIDNDLYRFSSEKLQ